MNQDDIDKITKQFNELSYSDKEKLILLTKLFLKFQNEKNVKILNADVYFENHASYSICSRVEVILNKANDKDKNKDERDNLPFFCQTYISYDIFNDLCKLINMTNPNDVVNLSLFNSYGDDFNKFMRIICLVNHIKIVMSTKKNKNVHSQIYDNGYNSLITKLNEIKDIKIIDGLNLGNMLPFHNNIERVYNHFNNTYNYESVWVMYLVNNLTDDDIEYIYEIFMHFANF
jgi:hypothetical protein